MFDDEEDEENEDDRNEQEEEMVEEENEYAEERRKIKKIPSDPRIEVTYELFASTLWNRVNKKKLSYHPSLVWMEIISFIKGKLCHLFLIIIIVIMLLTA